jgi:hypothetical protein
MTDDQVQCGHCFGAIQPGEPSVILALPADVLVGLLELHPGCAVALGKELVSDGQERALAHERWKTMQISGFTAPSMPTPPSDPLETMPRERLWDALWQVLPAAMRGEVSRSVARFLARVRALFRRQEFEV